jgi:thiosulfate/3-mercaptopyruvate sulfurtransferase
MQPIVSIDWLHQHLNDSDLIILDASMASGLVKYDPISTELRIPDARFFDFKNTFQDKGSPLPNTIPSPGAFEEGCRQLGIDKDSKIVIYDFYGVYTSPRAWWMFKAMGHKEVAVLDGGLPAWMNSGKPTEPLREEYYERGNFKAHYQPGLVRNAQYVLDHLDDPNVKVLDARSEGRFTGQTPEPRGDMKSGHMPNAINLPYGKVLKDGHYLPKEELTKIFDELNLGDASLTFSCGSGITACVIMLASELATHNPKSVYDGSWSEWGQASEDFPVVQ